MEKEKSGSRGGGVREAGTACNFKHRNLDGAHLEGLKEVRKRAVYLHGRRVFWGWKQQLQRLEVGGGAGCGEQQGSPGRK